MRFAISFLTILSGYGLLAQNDHPQNGMLFLQDEVARVDILLPADTLTLMYDSIYYAAEHEFEATFIYTTSVFSDTLSQVGFRFRGNTSVEAEKKNFKVSFNTFTPGGDYLGVEKLNLNGEHNDVSLARSKLSWELFAHMGLPTSRTSYVAVYINGDYHGLYLNVEHIDEEFIKKRYDKKVGNLYKCLWPATLEYWGSDPDLYKAEAGDRRIYELKTNEHRDDYIRLAQFIDILNNTEDAEFVCEIEQVFNVDDYLKIAAIDILIGNWDGYIFNKNNYYLYENPLSGRIEYIPYDLDNTWGVDWFGVDWTQQDIYNYNWEDRPLYDRLMADPTYREQFSFYLDQLMNGPFSEGVITDRLDEIQTMIAPYVEPDPFYPLDYGFTYADFLESGTTAWGEHVAHGIIPYVASRSQTATQDLESYGPLHAIKEIRDSLMDLETHLITVWIEGDTDNLSIEVQDGDVSQDFPMYDDGLHMDGEAGDGRYTAILSGSDWGEYIDYFIQNIQGTEVVQEPCDMNRVWFSPDDGPLYINELMPANDAVIQDEAGEYDDWLELVNPGPSAVYLGDYYLTDDIHCPNKWQLPREFITNDAFLLIWADDDEEQGLYHTNFRLDADGEELALFGTQAGALRLIDHFEYPSTAADHSWGRLPDATGPWVIFSATTPGMTNGGGVLGLETRPSTAASLFPNPSTGVIQISGEELDHIEIYTTAGVLVYQERLAIGRPIDLSALAEGVYLARMIHSEGSSHIQRLVIMR